jgi:hypothetical protein
MHQDIAPRNLLVDPETDQIQIFDFNFSSTIESEGLSLGRDNVSGVLFTLYEIIIRDERLRGVAFDHQRSSDIESIEWVKHPVVRLDHEVATYQKFALD